MPTEAQSLADEWAAARMVSRLFRHLDERDYPAAAALFGAEGSWTRMGRRLVGAAQIEAALATRPARLATRHLVTNMMAEQDGDGVSARYYITVYEDEAADGGPGRLGAPGAIFATHDRLRRTAEGWRFVTREPVLHFRKPPDGN